MAMISQTAKGNSQLKLRAVRAVRVIREVRVVRETIVQQPPPNIGSF